MSLNEKTHGVAWLFFLSFQTFLLSLFCFCQLIYSCLRLSSSAKYKHLKGNAMRQKTRNINSFKFTRRTYIEKYIWAMA